MRRPALSPSRALHALLTAWCVVWLPLAATLFELAVWPCLAIWGLARRLPLDALARAHNQLFGRTMVMAAWPMVRLQRSGLHHLPAGSPCVVVVNHRSFVDVLVCSFLPFRRYVVFVRAWPFRIWPLGHYMRLAGYHDIESASIEEVIEGSGRRHAALGDCFLFFPEGHRSRTGHLQRFRLGAFSLAVRYGLPVVPVCLSGTERLMSERPWARPIRVTMAMQPPIHPAAFDGDHPEVALKQAVRRVYCDYFGEN